MVGSEFLCSATASTALAAVHHPASVDAVCCPWDTLGEHLVEARILADGGAAICGKMSDGIEGLDWGERTLGHLVINAASGAFASADFGASSEGLADECEEGGDEEHVLHHDGLEDRLSAGEPFDQGNSGRTRR